MFMNASRTSVPSYLYKGRQKRETERRREKEVAKIRDDDAAAAETCQVKGNREGVILRVIGRELKKSESSCRRILSLFSSLSLHRFRGTNSTLQARLISETIISEHNLCVKIIIDFFFQCRYYTQLVEVNIP